MPIRYPQKNPAPPASSAQGLIAHIPKEAVHTRRCSQALGHPVPVDRDRDRGCFRNLEPGGGLNLLAQNELNEQCYATPAFAEGKIYLRTVKSLYCFGQKN